MKKFLKGISMILLTILIIILINSYGIENTLIKTISETFTQKKISGYILDEVIKDNSNSDELLKLENDIRSSDYINKITSKYLKNIVDNVVNGTDKKLEIKEELADIVNKKMNSISDSKKQEILKGINKIDFNEISVNISENIENMNPLVIQIFNIYNLISNIWFKIVLLIMIILIICINLIFTDNKIEELKKIGICCIISSIALLLEIVMIKFGTNFLSNRLMGRTADIDLTLITISSIFDLIIGLILVIINKKSKVAN